MARFRYGIAAAVAWTLAACEAPNEARDCDELSDCPASSVCQEGVCVRLPDAAPGGDGAVPDGAVPDGAVPDGAVPDGAAPDGAAPDAGGCAAPEPDPGCGDDGTQAWRCVDGDWVPDGPCIEPGGCVDGDEAVRPCGLNGRGTGVAVCEGGAFGEPAACDDPDVCLDGTAEERDCGLNGRGARRANCVEGAWREADCADPDECRDGAQGERACGARAGATEATICVDGRVRASGECVDAVCDRAVAAPLGESRAPAHEGAFDRGTCGGDGPEQAFTFNAPADSWYQLSAAGTAADASLYLRSACLDAESELACATGRRDTPATLLRHFAQGERATAVVDLTARRGAAFGLRVVDACAEGLPIATPERALGPARSGFPDLAFAGDRVGLSFYDGGIDGADNVLFGIYDLDGHALVEPAPVVGRQARVSEVEWNGEGFGVVWADQERNHSLYYRPFSAAGVGGESVRLVLAEAELGGARALALAWDGEAFVLAYTQLLPGNVIQGLRFAPDGTVLAGPTLLIGNPDINGAPALVPGADGFALAWMDAGRGFTYRPAFARFTRELARRGEVRYLEQDYAELPSLTMTAEGEGFLVAYELEEELAGRVRVRRLDAQGAPVGTPLTIGTGDNEAFGPQVAVIDGHPGLLWTARDENGEVEVSFQRLSVGPDGVQRLPPRIVLDGHGERYGLGLLPLDEGAYATWVEGGLRFRRGHLRCP